MLDDPSSSSSYAPTDLLHWGTSVEVNDDLRRSIRSEIDQIDHGITVTVTNVKSEERSFAALSKDLQRARGEMMDFRRGGADYSEGAMVNDEVLGRLKEEFGAEMAPHVVSPGSSMHRGVDEAASNSEDGERNSSDGATEESGHHGGADGSGGSTKRVHSHGKFLARKKLELKSKAVSLSSLKKEVEQNIKKVSSTHDETSNILHVIQSRQLDATKTAGERNVDARRRELEAESQRNRGVKEAIQAARVNSGGFAQKIAEKAREQISERSNNISEESALTSQNSTKQQDLALLKTDEKKIDAEMAPLSGQLDVLIQDHAEAESLLKKSHSLQPDLERIRSEVLTLSSTYDETYKKSEQSNMELNEVNASVEEASNIAMEVELEKNENDKAEAEVMLPAIAKKSDAIKEKEQLAGEVANMHKKIMETDDANQDIASTFGTKQSALIAKLKDIKEKLEQSRHEFEELEHKAASDEATGLESIKEVKDFSSKFEEATKAEISRLEEMKRQRVDERVEKLEKRRSNLASIEDARFREIDAIKQGLDLIKEVKVIETTLRETDVVLDENVEDSMQWPEYKHAFESTGSYTNSSSEAVHAIHGNDYDDAQASVCGEAASPTAKRR